VRVNAVSPGPTHTEGTERFGDYIDQLASLAPAGKTLYVINSDFPGTLSPISTATRKAGQEIWVGGGDPTSIAITPNGKTAYIGNDAGVTPFDLKTDRPRPAVGDPASKIVITPNGKTAYTYTWQGVIPIHTATNTAGPLIPVPGSATTGTAGMVLTPDGKTLYVLLQIGGVVPIDTATNTAGTPIPAGNYDAAIAITPDGKTAYTDDCSNTTPECAVIPIDTATNTAGTPIAAGAADQLPFSLVMAPGSRLPGSPRRG
jgi:DNA-binding beta-propeller fold protein YncE